MSGSEKLVASLSELIVHVRMIAQIGSKGVEKIEEAQRLLKNVAENFRKQALATSIMENLLSEFSNELSKSNDFQDTDSRTKDSIALLRRKDTPYLVCADTCAILHDSGRGLSIDEIARNANVTERHVRNLLQAASFEPELRAFIENHTVSATYVITLIQNQKECGGNEIDVVILIERVLDHMSASPSVYENLKKGKNKVTEAVVRRFKDSE